jgi:hypothetical protein
LMPIEAPPRGCHRNCIFKGERYGFYIPFCSDWKCKSLEELTKLLLERLREIGKR